MDEKRTRRWIPLAVFLALVAAVALFGGRFTPGPWYQELNKPAWTPPGYLFAPIWSLLYLFIAIAGWRVWLRLRDLAAPAMWLFGLQLIANGLWSWLFFGLQRPLAALVDLTLLWTAVAAVTLLFWRVDRVAGALFIPYLLWVSFAFALNAAIWALNR